MPNDFVMYNGVMLTVVKTNQFARRGVYDDRGNYLYTEFEWQGSSLLNPATVAYAQNLETGSLEAVNGTPPVGTDNAIRHYLMQPRRPLLIVVGGSTWVESPALGAQDCNGGPVPEVYAVRRVDGHKTMRVDFGVKTWLKECPSGQGEETLKAGVPFLASHFTQEHIIDDQYMTTVVTTGTTSFRTDVISDNYRYYSENPPDPAEGPPGYPAAYLVNLYSSPDAFARDANSGIPEPPPGFAREAIRVRLDPNGGRAHWQVVDKERPYNLGQLPEFGADGIGSNLYGVTKCRATFATQTIGGGEGPVAKPFVAQEVTVEAWGVKSTTNSNLILFAYLVADQRMALSAPGGGKFINKIAFWEEMTDRHVQVVVGRLVPLASRDPDQPTITVNQVFRETYGAEIARPKALRVPDAEPSLRPTGDGELRGTAGLIIPYVPPNDDPCA